MDIPKHDGLEKVVPLRQFLVSILDFRGVSKHFHPPPPPLFGPSNILSVAHITFSRDTVGILYGPCQEWNTLYQQLTYPFVTVRQFGNSS